jgi:hypothetical protein
MSRGAYKLLALVLFGFVGAVILSASAYAISSGQTVQLTVPNTSLQVTGLSARQALVTIEINDIVAGSTTSNNDGVFSHVLASVPSGVQKISVQYEVEGRKSLKQTKSVSLQSQQQTTVDFLLPPILYVVGSNEINVSENIVLEGFSVPNTTVTLQSATGFNLQTATNQSGRYIFSVSSGQFFSRNVSFTSLYKFSGQNSALSDTVSISINGLDSRLDNDQSQPGGSRPEIIINPLQPTSPTITYPEGAQLSVDGNSILFKGRAQIGAQIIAYANGQIAGSVTVNQDGDWEFFYTSTEERVLFQFSACIGQSCSLLSESVEIQFNTSKGSCSIDFRLENYRFWNLVTMDNVTLSSDIFPVGLEVAIDWGDGLDEKFSYDAGDQFKYEHAYMQPGTFNGSISVITDDCVFERYFSVVVDNDKSSTLLSGFEIRNLMLLMVFLLPFSIYFYRHPQD